MNIGYFLRNGVLTDEDAVLSNKLRNEGKVKLLNGSVSTGFEGAYDLVVLDGANDVIKNWVAEKGIEVYGVQEQKKTVKEQEKDEVEFKDSYKTEAAAKTAISRAKVDGYDVVEDGDVWKVVKS